MGPSSKERLRDAVFEVVENQIEDNAPPETKETYDRLISEGFPRDEVMRLIGSVVVLEIFEVLKKGRVYDEEKYVKALKALPKLLLETDSGYE